MVELKNISYSKNNIKIFNNINLKINKNELIYLTGENGSGKSSLAYIISGLIKNFDGEIIFENNSIKNNEDHFFENIVGYIFQNPENQFITSIVENDLAFGLEKYNLKYEEINFKIKNILKKLNIENLLKRNISTLSGGEKQRIAICAMLLLNKKLIIFDEPTSMLDPKNSKIILDIINDLITKYNKTIILITHDKIVNKLKNFRILKLEKGNLYE